MGKAHTVAKSLFWRSARTTADPETITISEAAPCRSLNCVKNESQYAHCSEYKDKSLNTTPNTASFLWLTSDFEDPKWRQHYPKKWLMGSSLFQMWFTVSPWHQFCLASSKQPPYGKPPDGKLQHRFHEMGRFQSPLPILLRSLDRMKLTCKPDI